MCSGRLRRLLSDPFPVCVFHLVEPKRFEDQLRFLVKNEFSTMTGDGLLEHFERRTQKSN